ncbi:hypothetical protein MNBD_GAMMA20-341 [hydrothermal vent metagenome]|uniref:TolB protein, periplasmic protein involved in the tonb-independent uptake of group A colicins n=1 Tax=hydrothermal vent metagenome TaxID=652676 RepID=A0A3B1AA02_9ZZZZ
MKYILVFHFFKTVSRPQSTSGGLGHRALRLIIVLGIMLLFSPPATSATLHDPVLNWQTLHTEHFAIHFHDGEQPLAEELAAIAERIHQTLSVQLQWIPRDKTDVVLTDRMDFSNGWATPVPQNHITLITTPPASVEDYQHWMELLFIHEYTHILHMDKKEGLPKLGQALFGRLPILFPNLLQPTWLKEGLATYMETDRDKGIGRGQSSLFRTMMRLEWQNGIKPLSQVSAGTTDWPAGTTAYLYGVYFYQFLADHYGKESIQQLINGYSDNIIPFMLNTNTRQVLGKNLTTLWQEFDQYLAGEFRAQLESLEKSGANSGKRLTTNAYRSGRPQVLPNGDVLYIQDRLYNWPLLMRLSATNGQVHEIAEVRGFVFDAHSTAGILLIQTELSNNTNRFNDIYLINQDDGSETRLTEGGRYRYAIWDQNAQHILAVHYKLGRHSLHRLDRQGQYLETLWQGEDASVIGGIDLAPDGAILAAAVWRPDSRWNLELFDLKQGEWQKLTNTAAIETQPRFSPDGTGILFSADYEDIYNIHRIDLQDRQRLTRLTHLTGGGFYPALSMDGRTLYYSHLGTGGVDLYSQPVGDYPLATTIKIPRDAPKQYGVLAEFEISDYRPSRHLMPRWWFPYLLADTQAMEAGIYTSANDPLWRHNLQLLLAANLKHKLPIGYIDYRYDRWQPILQLYVSREHGYYRDSANDLLRIRSEDTLLLAIERPFLRVLRRWSLHAGLVFERTQDSVRTPGVARWRDTRQGMVGVALSYDDTVRYPLSISRNDGRVINLVVEDNDIMEGDFSGRVVRLDWREFIHIGEQQSLALQLSAGQGGVNTSFFRLGGTFGDRATLPGNLGTPSLFNKRKFPLRGYPQGLNILTGENMLLLNTEWRFPLHRTGRTLMSPPVGIQQLSGKVFYNIGAAGKEVYRQENRYSGAGVELEADVILGYILPLTLRVGFATGFDPGGENQAYFSLERSF